MEDTDFILCVATNGTMYYMGTTMLDREIEDALDFTLK